MTRFVWCCCSIAVLGIAAMQLSACAVGCAAYQRACMDDCARDTRPGADRTACLDACRANRGSACD